MRSPSRRPTDGPPVPFPQLAAFFAFLRRRGLGVGVGAELDLGRALRHIPVLDRDSFREACRATLAKSPSDLAILDEAFEVYWSARPPSDAERSPEPAIPASPPADGAPAVHAPRRPSPMVIDSTGVVRIGVYSPDAPPGGHPLVPLGHRRLTAMRTGARRFRRYAATLPGRRFEPAHRGDVDFAATSRASLRHGGEWLDVRRKRRKRLRTELAILWDVSGSMRQHDDELFALVYSLHRASPRCRVFAFSTHLEELTDRLRGRAYRRAAEEVSRFLGPAGGGTQIGRCLRDFDRRYGASVHPRTAVVVLSDGWDLGGTEILRRTLDRLRHRAGLLAWVNPYARAHGFRPETAAMSQAMRYVGLLLAPGDFESARPSPFAGTGGRA